MAELGLGGVHLPTMPNGQSDAAVARKTRSSGAPSPFGCPACKNLGRAGIVYFKVSPVLPFLLLFFLTTIQVSRVTRYTDKSTFPVFPLVSFNFF